jgi:hypothetical protein
MHPTPAALRPPLCAAPWLAGQPIAAVKYVWLALYSPADAVLNASTPVRYQMCIANATFQATGTCEFTFRLNNLHTGGYSAYLISGGITGTTGNTTGTVNTAPTGQRTYASGGSKPWVDVRGADGTLGRFFGSVLGMTTTPVTFAAPNEPTHVRVTPAVGSAKLSISWNQNSGSTGGALKWATTAAGVAAGTSVAATSTTITQGDVCPLSPASLTGFRSMGTQWTAMVDFSSAAGRTVYYTVGDGAATSAVFTLSVPLARGDATPFSFLIWADQGVGYTDDSVNGRNYNNGKAALQVANLAAAHAAGASSPTARFMMVSGDMTCVMLMMTWWRWWWW